MVQLRLPLSSREAGGMELAKKLKEYTDDKNTIVLALVRGGVATGRALADALRLPLHPYTSRKLGHPKNMEFGVGAIAQGGGVHFDEAVMRWQGITMQDLKPIIDKEMEEMRRRQEMYATDDLPDLQGKTVILVDDGAATGGTMLATIKDMKDAKVAKVIVALPVAPPDTVANLEVAADEVLCLATPEPFHAVGWWYEDFPQLEDEEVVELLKK